MTAYGEATSAPALVLVNRKGVVRYTHIGEGDYEETEALIRKLLAEK